MAGTLFIVATPIGNLDDMTMRAIATLKSVSKIYAEDTRVGRKLLNHFEINKPLDSYHQHSPQEKKLLILNDLLSGEDVALISDAGTPGISDPGNELVDFIYTNSEGIKVIPIPGPSALAAALSVCGFDVSHFLFIGFWPKKKGKKIIELIKRTNSALVFYESPMRIIKTLQELSGGLGSDRRVFIGRELTKMFETHYRGTLQEVVGLINSEKSLKGELVVIIE